MKKVISTILAIAMLCCLAVSASAAGLADLTATRHNLTATRSLRELTNTRNLTGTRHIRDLTGTKKPGTPTTSNPSVPTVSTNESENASDNANHHADAAAASKSSRCGIASKKGVVNTGDAGLAVAGAVTALAAAAFVVTSKKK